MTSTRRRQPPNREELRALAPWSVERSLSIARWLGGGVAILQAWLFQPGPQSRPWLRSATVVIGIALVLANVALLPALRRQRVTKRLAALLFSTDFIAVCGFIWLYFDNADATQWVLLMIIQLEAAYRWAMRGAIGTAVASAVAYGVARVLASREFGFDLTIDSLTYVAGLTLVQAFVVGGMAERLRSERDSSLELSEAAIALNAGLDRRAILEAVAHEATRIADAAIAVVWVPSDGGFVPAASHGLPPDVAESARLPEADPVFGEPSVATAFRTRESVIRSDAGAHMGRPVLESVVLPRVWRSVASVPIVHPDGPLGVLSCYGKGHAPPPETIARLETLVSLCGVALTNASVFQHERASLESLQALDRLKDDFLATVSHELRTPLTVVQGFATTLRARWDDLTEEKRQDIVRRLESQATGLHERIGDLLDFARLQSGELELRFIEFDLGPLVRETISTLEPSLTPHPVRSEAVETTCFGDPTAVTQILENLLLNAARYSAPDSPIEVVVRQVDQGFVEMSVVDRGIGVPDDEREHIFERFYRGRQDEVRAKRGTGIGLAIVRELTDAMGGQVTLDTAVGSGSTFSVRLPARAPEDGRGRIDMMPPRAPSRADRAPGPAT